ncbi:hypothetical protein Tco_0808253 [Tanacetum coccineum]
MWHSDWPIRGCHVAVLIIAGSEISVLVIQTGKSRAENFSKNSPSHERHSFHSINIIDSQCEEISNQKEQSSGSTTSHSDLSLLNYESFCFNIDHQGDKSSGSTTSKSDHSLPDYEAFSFDHQEEKSSGSTTSHSHPSLLEYELFYFDLSIDPLPPAKRSDSHHEEFADELAHIISPPEYDHFYFDIEVDPGELNRLLIENSSSKNVNLTEIKEDNELKPKTSTKKLSIHELYDFHLLLSNYDSTFSEEFSEIDFLVSFHFVIHFKKGLAKYVDHLCKPQKCTIVVRLLRQVKGAR